VWIYRTILPAVGAPPSYIYTAFETRADHLLIGCALAICLRYQYFARFLTMICARTAYMLVPVGGMLLSAVAWVRFGDSYRDAVGFIVDPVLIAVLMVQLLATRDRRLAWMDSGWLVYLGTISYSTYLYHKLAGELVEKALSGRVPFPMVVIIGVLGTYAAASVSYHVVEKPFLLLRDRIRRGFRRMRGTGSISAVTALSQQEIAPG
jgi:peptidoglycan/LPS O-acetylase OafA/YrhL